MAKTTHKEPHSSKRTQRRPTERETGGQWKQFGTVGAEQQREGSVQRHGKWATKSVNSEVSKRESPISPRDKVYVRKEGSIDLDKDWTGLFSFSTGDKIEHIKNGITKVELSKIKDEIDLDYDTLGKILSVSRSTLLNKKPKQKFDQATSEKIMLLADLLSYGLNVFEEKERFYNWLKKPNKALGEQAPLEKMDTFYGIQEVKNEIGRIEYGVY